MEGLAHGVLGQYGVWGLVVGLVINRLGIPFPTEVSLSLTGLAVHQGVWQLGPTLVAVVLAQMTGLVLAYLLVRVHWKRERGVARLIHSKRMKHLQKHIKGRESHMIFVSLVVPGLHGVAGYAAGLAKMPFWRFAVVALAGVVVWTVGLMTSSGIDTCGGRLATNSTASATSSGFRITARCSSVTGFGRCARIGVSISPG